ncbi:tetratricopeptide repeat protein 31 isoform X2 [Phaenicophaeus curvirostris]|uniref:tetratricopeptide repeat protein 31 isoform X2 n=1 Tax=Phaenicophaeus curvirostris TaxID=33595 RepID=UPI0037F098B6
MYCHTSGPGAAPLPVRLPRHFRSPPWPWRPVRMRGASVSRGPAGAASPCPWGCSLGTGGWSGAPFCPRHCPPAAEEPEAPAGTGSPAGGGAAPHPGPGAPIHIPAPVLRAAAWGGVGLGPRLWIRLNRPEGPGEDEEHKDCDEYEEDEDEEEEEWLGLPWGRGDLEILSGFCCDTPGASSCPEPPAAALQEKLRRLPTPRSAPRSPEEVERNAQELLAEEERVKRKAEKKKLKKKKQKDRKKREKLEQEQKTQQRAESGTVGAGDPRSSCDEERERQPDPSPSPGLQDSTGSSGDEGGDREPRAEETEEELDLSCSFVCKARQKVRLRPPVLGKEQPAGTGDTEPGRRGPGTVPDPDPGTHDVDAVERSLDLAGHGNAAAQEGRFAVAVQAFSEAVRLNPWEHRLLGNRSYCYERLGCFEEALSDALAALALRPGWAKGLFRKGKALRGLQRYAEAARAFEEVLRVDGSGAEARAQLEQCQALLRQSSPGDRRGAGGVPVTPSLPEAAEPPRGNRVTGSRRHTDISGCETPGSPRSRASGPQALPPSHPARDCFPLWVGNLTGGVGEKVLRRAFGRFGEIRSLRTLPGRHCAFINFSKKKAAEAAYAAMQAAELGGCRLALQLKHPSHATPAPTRDPGRGTGAATAQPVLN